VQLWLRAEPDSSTMASLAQLTGLRRLQRLAVTDPCRFSGRLFNPLTALTQLTYLALPYYLENFSSMELLLSELHGKPSPQGDRWPILLCSVITSTVSGPLMGDMWVIQRVAGIIHPGAQPVPGSGCHLSLACQEKLQWLPPYSQPLEFLQVLGSNTPLDSVHHMSAKFPWFLHVVGVEGFCDPIRHMHLAPHCIAPHLIMPAVAHLIIPLQAPDGAPPDVWSQLLSCCEACAAQATQQHMGAAAVGPEEQQQVDLEPAPQQEQQQEVGDDDEEQEPLAGPG